MQGVKSIDLAFGSQLAATGALAFFVPSATVPGPVTTLVIANVVGLAVASTALAYVIYFRLIADLGPARALTVTFLIPLFGVLWGALFLGEALTQSLLAGGLLIVAGTVLTLRGGPPRGRILPAQPRP
jgi:drug/metabolite transporter (DMT)-like permease